LIVQKRRRERVPVVESGLSRDEVARVVDGKVPTVMEFFRQLLPLLADPRA